MGLMMMEFDPEKVRLSSQEWFIFLKKRRITELSACACLMPDSLNWGKVLFRFRGDFLGNWRSRSLRSPWQS
jgi:hypothetical protein